MPECAMQTNSNLRLGATKEKQGGFKLRFSVWMAGIVARTLFLIVLAVITARVASPQIENIKSLLETPGDLIRVGLGFTACVWLVANVFILPRDAEAYRTWMYLGVSVLPLSLLCAFVVW
jgi:hypothetical protein